MTHSELGSAGRSQPALGRWEIGMTSFAHGFEPRSQRKRNWG